MAESNSVKEGEIKVGVIVPSMGHWHTSFGLSLVNMMMETRTVPFPNCSKQAAFVISVQSSLLPFSRDKALREAMKEECTHLLWLDSDMMFPKMTLHEMLRHDVPFVAANYVVKSLPAKTTAVLPDGRPLGTSKHSTGLVESGGVGLGIALVQTEYLKSMRPPFFMVDWYGKTNSYRGEDIYFCQKFLRMTGQKIYVDQDLSKQVQHMGLYPYSLALLDGWEKGYHNNILCGPEFEQSEENDNVA